MNSLKNKKILVIIKEFLDLNCHLIASSISFYTLFAIFPLILLATSILGFILGTNDTSQLADFSVNLAKFLPVSTDFISDTIYGISIDRPLSGTFGVVALAWASTSVFATIRKGINITWGINKTRNIIQEKLIDFMLVVIVSILLIFGLLSGPILSIAIELIRYFLPDSEIFTQLFWNISSKVIFPTMSFLTILFLYTYIPYTKINIKEIIPFALLTAFVFNLGNFAFIEYLKISTHYNLVYGSIAGILALLTWVYISSLILLFGSFLSSKYIQNKSSDNQNINLQ
ncbi:MAG: YihY/virulence factor BrkB family protein [SAR202 cluster bacterium]|nr:YihY/virulence factor BrkB family protein [SAR202 cluster bacterium]